jgi:hypothetical protein
MGSKPLSPQELRQALHPGSFLDFADEASTKSTAIRGILGNDSPDFRMRDVELLIRYLSFKHLLNVYRGNLKEFLDEACAQFNRDWSFLNPELKDDISELDSNVVIVHKGFGSNYNFGKWVGGRFETRFNRAVFDILVQALAVPGVSAAVQQAPEKMADAFKQLCSTDNQFLDAIERTTKSIEATRYRFIAWYKALSDAFGLGLPDPSVGTSISKS